MVDERIVGRKAKSLSFEEAAAMPLTNITAWEALYNRLSLYPDTIREKTAAPPSQPTTTTIMSSTSSDTDTNKRRHHPHPSSILIIGGAGGVGSIAIQVAKNLVNQSRLSSSSSFSGINIIANASRNESVEWCKRMGADYVINHHKDLKSQIKELVGIDYTDYIPCLNDTDSHFESMKQLVAPQGKICSIVACSRRPRRYTTAEKCYVYLGAHVYQMSISNTRHDSTTSLAQHSSRAY
jgi:NADPH:quinone reductase-like Zn-dependent oxidoreductase